MNTEDQELKSLTPPADETCKQCGKELFGAAARYNLDQHMRHRHPNVPWVPEPKKTRNKRKSDKSKATGRDPLPEEAKVVALALLELTGSPEIAFEVTGISPETLAQWNSVMRAARQKRDGQSGFAAKVEHLAESMMQLMLLRARQYTPEQMMKVTSLLCEAVPRLRIARAPKTKSVRRAPAVPPSGEPLAAGPAPVLDATKLKSEREKWEEIVAAAVASGAESGEPITEAQAIAALCRQKPEARRFLQKSNADDDKPTESEAVN